jgi:hypothetical protein
MGDGWTLPYNVWCNSYRKHASVSLFHRFASFSLRSPPSRPRFPRKNIICILRYVPFIVVPICEPVWPHIHELIKPPRLLNWTRSDSRITLRRYAFWIQFSFLISPEDWKWSVFVKCAKYWLLEFLPLCLVSSRFLSLYTIYCCLRNIGRGSKFHQKLLFSPMPLYLACLYWKCSENIPNRFLQMFYSA